MCVPQNLGALQIVNAISQGLSAQSNAKEQQKRSEAAARQANEKAKRERQQGRLESNKRKVETQNLLSRARNSLAGAGIDTTKGTAVDLIEDKEEKEERIRKQNLKTSLDRAKLYETDAENARENLSFNKQRARRDLFSRGSTLLTRNIENANKRGLLRF